VKPPIAYYGAKITIADRIVSLLPCHEHYVEPFAGSLAVLFAKPRSRMETVNDLDRQLVGFWRTLRDRPADLERVCALTPHSRVEHDAAYDPVPEGHPDPELEAARRVWVALNQGRAGTLLRTGWRYHISHRDRRAGTMASRLATFTSRIAPAAERLAHVSLECRPALEVIAAYGTDPDVLLYVDPPYPAGVRTSTQYAHEMPHEPQHRDLAAALHDARAAVVLSGYHSPLYDDLYAGWHRHEVVTETRQGGAKVGRVEVLWSNRPFAAQEGLFAS
jgi:DNA adenine methylase